MTPVRIAALLTYLETHPSKLPPKRRVRLQKIEEIYNSKAKMGQRPHQIAQTRLILSEKLEKTGSKFELDT